MTKPAMLNILQRALDTPLMLDPAKAAVIAQSYGPRWFGLEAGADVELRGWSGTVEPSRVEPRAASLIGDEMHRTLKRRGGGYSNIQGVAVIPVTGTLVRRGSWIGESSGQTSYEGLSAQIRAAAEDPDVRAIALEIDSFGGEAAGIFDICAQIRAVREVKQVHAFIADYALSAGYAIASQADRITVPPFGEAGSIGVVMMHASYEGWLKNQGIAISLIHSGAHKVDGNPFETLPEETRAQLQKEGDAMWLRFAQEVSLGRKGRISPEAALKTEARVFRGEAAVRAGLADAVSEARTAFEALVNELNPEAAPISVAARPAAAGVMVPAAAARPDPFDALAETAAAQPNCSPGCETGATAPQPQETGMSNDVTQPEAETQTAPKPGAQAPATAPAAPPDNRDAAAEERERCAKITAKVAAAGLPSKLATDLIQEGTPLADAYERILDAKAESGQDGGNIRGTTATVTGDARDRMREGMTRALNQKARVDGGERNEFSSMTLREMARASLIAQGLSIPAGGVQALASAVFVPSMAGGMHSTSDFANILADVANKSMLKGFSEAPETFPTFTSVGTMSDFKATKRVGLDAFPSLKQVAEGAEFKYGTIGDHGETAILATYGSLFAITRQTIINDDIDAISKVPSLMGRAAKRTVGDLVFAVLSANAAMSDTVALFHANHGNLAGSASGPSEAAINAGITAMANQTDRSGTARLNIGPKYLLAPPKYRSNVLQALNSEYAPDDTDKAGSTKMPRAYNTVKDAAEPIFDARITGDEWYLLADPNMHDTLEVGYLDGIETPFMDQQTGWTVDGTEFKVRIDATATPLAYQGMFKNAGS